LAIKKEVTKKEIPSIGKMEAKLLRAVFVAARDAQDAGIPEGMVRFAVQEALNSEEEAAMETRKVLGDEHEANSVYERIKEAD
jgi:hypothetical protein